LAAVGQDVKDESPVENPELVQVKNEDSKGSLMKRLNDIYHADEEDSDEGQVDVGYGKRKNAANCIYYSLQYTPKEAVKYAMLNKKEKHYKDEDCVIYWYNKLNDKRRVFEDIDDLQESVVDKLNKIQRLDKNKEEKLVRIEPIFYLTHGNSKRQIQLQCKFKGCKFKISFCHDLDEEGQPERIMLSRVVSLNHCFPLH
jgi:hypothetical protein